MWTEEAVAVTFSEVARPLLPRLYALARSLVHTDPEDLVQECLLKAFKNYEGLRDPQAAPQWFAAILVNCARDRHRHNERSPAQTTLGDVEDFSLFRAIAHWDPFPYSDSLHLDFLCGFGPEDVHAVLRRLPPMYRVPLVLVHMQDVSTKQAARMLEVPLGTVLARLHRGRKLFERLLWDYAAEHDLIKESFRAARAGT